MKSRQILIVVAFVLTAAGTARADFILMGTEHLDVTTSHTMGVLFDASTADILTGGYVENAYVNDDAVLRVMRPSGSAIYAAWAYDTGRIAISSGSVSTLRAYETSSVEVSGGSVSGYLKAYEHSTVAMFGGSVSTLSAYKYSSVAISGGNVSTLWAYETSSVAISGGDFAHVYASSEVAISGGSVSELHARENSSVDISGGGVSAVEGYGGTMTLHGYDFRVTGGMEWLGDDRVIGTGVLTGKWFDGTSWAMRITQHPGAVTIWTASDPAEILLPGDADCNRAVELADLSILAFNWDTQSGATWWMGDFDGDGDVDLSDLSALACNWGQSYANPPVPEPATMVLLGLGGLAIIRRRKRG